MSVGDYQAIMQDFHHEGVPLIDWGGGKWRKNKRVVDGCPLYPSQNFWLFMVGCVAQLAERNMQWQMNNEHNLHNYWYIPVMIKNDL